MSVIVSNAYALSAAESVDSRRPVVGWHNLVTAAGVAATYANASYPVTNLANPATSLLWKSTGTATQYLTITFTDPDPVDYAAVARHNWGSGLVAVTVQGQAPGGGSWTDLTDEQYLADDTPALFRFEATNLGALRFKLVPGSVVPQAAVVYCGALLPIGYLPAGHVPVVYAQQTTESSPVSQGGDFIGSVVTGQVNSTKIEQKYLDADWYRENMEPFRRAAIGSRSAGRLPFFFAWAPEDYPDEVGFCRVTNDPMPSPDEVTGEISITFQIVGLAI